MWSVETVLVDVFISINVVSVHDLKVVFRLRPLSSCYMFSIVVSDEDSILHCILGIWL